MRRRKLIDVAESFAEIEMSWHGTCRGINLCRDNLAQYSMRVEDFHSASFHDELASVFFMHHDR